MESESDWAPAVLEEMLDEVDGGLCKTRGVVVVVAGAGGGGGGAAGWVVVEVVVVGGGLIGGR